MQDTQHPTAATTTPTTDAQCPWRVENQS